LVVRPRRDQEDAGSAVGANCATRCSPMIAIGRPVFPQRDGFFDAEVEYAN
jgi:hypothetical protein